MGLLPLLVDSDEILKSYSADHRKEAEEARNDALIPDPPDLLEKLWRKREAEGQNKGMDVKRQMERIEADGISEILKMATYHDAAATFIESLRPRFAELSQSLGLGDQRNRGAAR